MPAPFRGDLRSTAVAAAKMNGARRDELPNDTGELNVCGSCDTLRGTSRPYTRQQAAQQIRHRDGIA